MTAPLPVLLDTHALFWHVEGDQKLPASSQAAIRTSEAFVSAVVAWELAIHQRKRRIQFPTGLESWWVRAVALLPAKVIPLTPEIAFRAESLPDFHGDPADRFHVATALFFGHRLVTVDGTIREWATTGAGKTLGLKLA